MISAMDKTRFGRTSDIAWRYASSLKLVGYPFQPYHTLRIALVGQVSK
jgi:hypothetical protein